MSNINFPYLYLYFLLYYNREVSVIMFRFERDADSRCDASVTIHFQNMRYENIK